MSWYKLSIDNSQVAAGEHARIQDRFDGVFTSLGGPRNMALFSLYEPDSGGVVLYFTPESASQAQTVLDELGAVACERPAKEVSLLVGHADALDRFKSGEL